MGRVHAVEGFCDACFGPADLCVVLPNERRESAKKSLTPTHDDGMVMA